MSDVTDLLVTCELMDDRGFEELVQWFDDNVESARLVRVDFSVIGHKACQAVVGLAAVNGFWQRDDFLEKVAEILWTFPDAVRLFQHTESGDAGFQELEWRGKGQRKEPRFPLFPE